MISKKLLNALNEQVKWEFGAANLYLSMSAYFENKGLSGSARWMRLQYEEEVVHALKIHDYLLSRGFDVKLGAIPEPPHKWKSMLDAFKAAAEHEAKVTALIDAMMAMAKEEAEYPTEIFLQWFVNEQVEEEETVKAIVERLEMIGDNGAGLIAMDRELGARVG